MLTELHATDWQEFQKQHPGAYAWLAARMVRREYDRLAGLAQRSAWEEERYQQLTWLFSAELPAPAR